MLEIIKEKNTNTSLSLDYIPESQQLNNLIENFKNSIDVKNPDFELHPAVQKKQLNQQRNKELKGFVISDVFMNEDIIKTMAVQLNIAETDEIIEWIDVNNQTVTFSKADFGVLIKQGSQKTKEIYFKYRALKNELEEA